MKSNFDADLQLNSAANQEPDRMDEHIRDLTAALAADVPADFTKNVMNAIRAERKKIALRNRLVRMGSAAVAALVIVPMAAIVLPAMIRGEKNADIASMKNDAAIYAPTDAAGDYQYSADVEMDSVDKTAAGDISASLDPTTENEISSVDTPAPEATAAPEATDASAPQTPAAAPDHMGKQQESPVETSPTAETFAADTKHTQNALSESPVITVLRTLIGKEKMDTWMADQPASEDTARDLIHAFGIRREIFIAAAEDLHLTFTQDELDALFDTPLTEK